MVLLFEDLFFVSTLALFVPLVTQAYTGTPLTRSVRLFPALCHETDIGAPARIDLIVFLFWYTASEVV